MKYKKCKVCNNDITKVNKKHNLVKCNSCSLVFCETIFREKEFISVYNDLINSPQYATHSIKEYYNLLEGKIEIGHNRKRIIDYILEHLQDLKLFLKLPTKNLSIGGNLIFSLPNYNKKLNFNEKNDEIYQSGPPIHLNYFTKKSIKKILTTYNFQIDFVKEKRFPYLDFKNKKLFSQILKSFFGLYHGSTLYVNAKYKG